MAKATDGLAFGLTRHCRIEGLPPVPPTPRWVHVCKKHILASSMPGGTESVGILFALCLQDQIVTRSVEIQQANAKKRSRSSEPPTAIDRTAAAEEPEEGREHGHEQVLGREKGEAKKRNEYECPYCRAKTHSSVRSGNVQVAGHCGKQFSCSKWGGRTFVHPCLPQLWHEGPVSEGVWKTTDQTPEA